MLEVSVDSQMSHPVHAVGLLVELPIVDIAGDETNAIARFLVDPLIPSRQVLPGAPVGLERMGTAVLPVEIFQPGLSNGGGISDEDIEQPNHYVAKYLVTS